MGMRSFEEIKKEEGLKMKVRNNCKPFKRKGKFRAFLEARRRVILGVLLFTLLFILFLYLNGVAEAWRGYVAIGGELMIFLMPFLIIELKEFFDDLIDYFK